MTVAQHLAQLRQLVLEHPEASNWPILVSGSAIQSQVVVHAHEDNHIVTIEEDADGARS